jgi:protein-arginine kinase activator protein McsA
MFGRDFNDFFRDFDKMMSQFDNKFNSSWKSNLDLNNWDKQVYESEDGSLQITTFSKKFKPESNEKNGLTKLKKQLEVAIENEDFESAVKLRDQIKSFEKNQEKLEKLELELKKMIDEQNFEKAIEIRDELKKLRS